MGSGLRCLRSSKRSCTDVHMKRYTVAQVRQQLANALDIAERGEPVSIERRGVTFELRRRVETRSSARSPKLFDVLDPSILEDDWHWSSPGEAMTLVMRPRRAKKKRG